MLRQFCFTVDILAFVYIAFIHPFYRAVRNLTVNIFVQKHCFRCSLNHRRKHYTLLVIFRYGNTKPRLAYSVTENFIISNDKARLIIRLFIQRF